MTHITDPLPMGIIANGSSGVIVGGTNPTCYTTTSGEQIPSANAIPATPTTAGTMTHEDAQEIIRLLKRIDRGLQHLESEQNAGIIWRDIK